MNLGSSTSARTTRVLARIGVLAAVLAAVDGRAADAKDWPRWRGPNADGISTDSDWAPTALQAEPVVVWQANVGRGWSSVTIEGRRLYTMGNKSDKDVVYCLDGGAGLEVWTYDYDCPKAWGGYAGPRATPVVHGDSVYTFSVAGHLHCLNAKDGSLKWRRDVAKEMKVKNLRWGFSASPCVDGPLVILNAGEHGMAFDANTGESVWSSGHGASGYATPVIFTLKGKRCAAIFGEKALHAVDVKTGKKLWSHPWEVKYDVNAADPIVSGDKIFISSGYGKGCALLDVSRGKPKQVWENKLLKNHFSSSVLFEGHLYGIDGNAGRGTLRCLDFKTGKEKWNQNLGFGSLMIAGGKLVVLNEKGELFIAEARPSAYEQIAKGKVLSPNGGKCWTMPVYCKGRIFCRNSMGDLVSISVSK